MGSSMAQSLSRLSGRRSAAMFAATRRSVLLFLIGVFVIGRDDSWKHKRIMGVLQRLAVAYFFTFAIRIFVSHKPLTAIRDFQNKHPRLAQLADIVPFWKDYICHLLLLLAWILTIFLVKVDGCPRGYIGPGGLTNNGRDANCTGGAAALIDRKILGLKHMYGTPTCQDVYECTGPFDPEGLLGCLTTIFQCFLGLQAGQIFVVYTKKRSRIVRLLFWALIYVLIGGALCQFQYAGGAIPINKNLWTPTFVFVTSGFAMASLAALFYVIDVGEWWDGEPFASAGKNPLTLYIGHEVVDGWVPVQWRVKETHAAQLAMNAWGSTFWLIVAYIMNRQKVYFSL